MKKRLLLAAAIISVSYAAYAADIIAPQFSLKDQNDKIISLSSLKGKVVVVIAFDRDSMQKTKPWKSALSGKYGSKIVLMSDSLLKGIPFFVKGAALDMIRKESGNTSTLLDWDGTFYSSYGLKANTPNVVVIDRGGVLRARENGEASGQPLEKVKAAIDWSIKYSHQ